MPNIANPPGGNSAVNPRPSHSPATPTPASAAVSAGPSTLVLIFRIVRWTVYACALVLLILLLHKSAPPAVSTTPEAAARAEQKFQDVQQAVAQGQPATLHMSETELNSYLASHLVLPAANAPSGSPNATPSEPSQGTPNG